MHKKGFINRNFRERYFRLEKGMLHYYANDSAPKERGVIELAKIISVKDDDNAGDEEHRFLLTPNARHGRVYCLKASTAADKAAWMAAITAQVCQKPGTLCFCLLFSSLQNAVTCNPLPPSPAM
jgi:hypothetical protein